MNTYIYEYGGKLYMNLTNKCSNSCGFCVRSTANGVGGHNLWLDKEPTAEEIIHRLNKTELDRYGEFVFCGFGEPLYAFDTLVEIGGFLRGKGRKTRLNTNGQAELILKGHERFRNLTDIVGALAEAVDTVSISLNASNAEKYNEICFCRFGTAGFYAMLDFAAECTGRIGRTIMSVVDTVGADEIERCGEIAENLGAEYRVRRFGVG
ncbi:MAG: TatD family nuclease-associated radical SAM protein [Clostridiales bacterium]|nr:TatD family nuclease-associated radical SAM protein [Clostridiales bacterium]